VKLRGLAFALRSNANQKTSGREGEAKFLLSIGVNPVIIWIVRQVLLNRFKRAFSPPGEHGIAVNVTVLNNHVIAGLSDGPELQKFAEHVVFRVRAVQNEERVAGVFRSQLTNPAGNNNRPRVAFQQFNPAVFPHTIEDRALVDIDAENSPTWRDKF